MLLSTSRLSESPIWRLQKTAYARLGVESWAKGRVPFQMTNNSRIAAQYADIVRAAISKEALTILELGGGCGKFAFLFLSELLERKISKVRYLLTDSSEKNVAFWNDHPGLKPWIDQGILQTAVFDPLAENLPFAVRPERRLVVANYFFDSIPQDLFKVEKGVLLEGIASLHADVETPDWDDPSLLPKIRISYDFRPLEENPYPELPEAWAVLEEYSRQFDGSSFTFSIGALKAIHRIESFSGDDFFFLAADRGPCSAEDFGCSEISLSLHGSAFSFPVNFHAIGRYMERKGGAAQFSKNHDADFCVALLSRKAGIARECMERTIAFGPLKTEAAHLRDIVKRLEEANWDAVLFFFFFDRIQEALGQATASLKRKMLQGMRRVKDRFFPLFGEEALLLERLGQLFRFFGEEGEAEAHFSLAARFSHLSRQCIPHHSIGAFLKSNPPFGDLLQIGGQERLLESIHSLKQGSFVHLSWKASVELMRKFDTILLFPLKVIVQKIKPPFLREIEERFSLDQIRYSDADIEMLFSTLGSKPDPEQLFRFFEELEKKKNISKGQFDRVVRRLGRDVPIQEDDHFFETLMVCLKNLMKPGSVLRAFIPGALTYDDPRFFETIAVDPFLEIEEKGDSEGIWVTVRKLG